MLGFYYRGRLQRRIFFWFLISIAMTAAVVSIVSFRSGSLYGPGWVRPRARVRDQPIQRGMGPARAARRARRAR